MGEFLRVGIDENEGSKTETETDKICTIARG